MCGNTPWQPSSASHLPTQPTALAADPSEAASRTVTSAAAAEGWPQGRARRSSHSRSVPLSRSLSRRTLAILRAKALPHTVCFHINRNLDTMHD